MNRRLPLVLLLAACGFLATPAFGQDCPPGSVGGLGFDVSDICKARVVEFETRIQELGGKLCSNAGSASTKALEERVAREFGTIAADCGDAFLASESALTQSYLYGWINGPSEGWGDDLKVRGFKVGENLGKYRTTVTSNYGDGLEAGKLPGWYKSDAAYSQAVQALLTGAQAQLKSGSNWALSDADTLITRFQTNAGLPDTDSRVKFLKEMYAAIKTPSPAGVPPELLAEYAKNPPLRLNGANGFYTEACNASAAKDDSLADALSLAWAAHLSQNGPGSLEKMEGAVNALKPGFSSWPRAEPVFGSEMTGAYMSNYVKKTYFADDSRVAEASPAMAKALADAVNGPAREKFGLPKIVSDEKSGDVMGMAGTKFDSNDNLRSVFPGKCDLDSVRGVKADGSTGDILNDNGWDPRGVYDADSFATNKDLPITELVFREPAGVNKDKARSYDVTLKCGDRTRKFRMNIPPRPDSTEPIDYVKAETAPPYADMLKDGKLNGLMIGGHHTRDGEVAVKAMKELGFREISRTEDVSISERFYELLGEKGADGKPKLDYYVKDAHANGYAFDAGMFRANKRGQEVVLEKTGPDGKKHRITVIGNKTGEGHDSPDGFETVGYEKYFDAVKKRGDEHLFVANFSCWSDGKSAFEWDGIRSDKVKYLPTDESATYYERYWSGIARRENTFQIVAAIDQKLDYAGMRNEFSNFDSEVLMPDDPTFVGKMTDKIKSHRASNSGIPVTVGLEDTRPSI